MSNPYLQDVSIHKIGFLLLSAIFGLTKEKGFLSNKPFKLTPSYRKRLVLKDVCLIMSVLGFCVES